LTSCQQQTPRGPQTSTPQISSGPISMDQTPAPSHIENERRIALLLPLSGAQADLGHTLSNAMELGFLETPHPGIKLLPFDTSSTPEGALEAIQKALGAGAQMIVGPLTATETRAIQGLAPLPILTLSNDRSVATDQVFTFGIMPDDQVQALMTHLHQKGILTIAVFAPKTTYGTLVSGLLQTTAAQMGLSLQVLSYAPEDLQNPEFVGALAGQGIGAFVLLEAGQNAAAVAALLAYKDLLSPSVTCYGLDNWRTSPDLATNPHFEGAAFASVDASGFETLSARYFAAFGASPHPIAGVGYDAIRVALFALSQGNNPTTTLTTPSGFLGTYGALKLLPTGANARTAKICTFKMGQIVPVDGAL
jgi:branched-chain amino acid transport system substrate-binding protein